MQLRKIRTYLIDNTTTGQGLETFLHQKRAETGKMNIPA